jgi:hypothetical protein
MRQRHNSPPNVQLPFRPWLSSDEFGAVYESDERHAADRASKQLRNTSQKGAAQSKGRAGVAATSLSFAI